MTPKRYHPGLAALAAVLAVAGVAVLVGTQFAARPMQPVPAVSDAVVADARASAAALHIAKPERVKGIYLTTASAVGTKYQDMLALADRTEINALVIDLKDDSGAPGFRIAHPSYQDVNREKPTIPDLAAVAAEAHARGIYLIARLPVFQDSWFADRRPQYAMKRAGGGLWRDNRGIRWLDPAARPVWEYNAVLAEEASAAGFDEIQVDYVRFASDGSIGSIVFPVYDGRPSKSEVMEEFFAWFGRRLRAQGAAFSVDLFGYTFRIEDGFDLGIGQRLALILPHVDAVSPMVYPSHYPPGHLGLDNPAAHPGLVVGDALDDGQTIIDAVRPEFQGVRPWLQDFHLGAHYTPAMVRQQIDAAESRGAEGWMLWNARNVYTESALKKE